MKKMMTVVCVLCLFSFGGVAEALSTISQKAEQHTAAIQSKSSESHTLVNINAVDAKQLAKLVKGIGQIKAEAIVSYRTAHGPFKTLSELAKVSVRGRPLSEAFVKRIQAQLTL